MSKQNIDALSQINEKMYREIYVLNSTITMIKESCTEKENKAVYYGLVKDEIKKISDERNNYINMLTFASDTISKMLSLSASLENELSLNQNTNNCSR